MSDAGLAFLRGLSCLQSLNLAGLAIRWALGGAGRRRSPHVPCSSSHPGMALFRPLCSDKALAALLPRLPRLRALNLERCHQAGDLALAAVGKHVRGLQTTGGCN